MCTPIPGEPQRDCRAGNAGIGNDSGFISDTIPNPVMLPRKPYPPCRPEVVVVTSWRSPANV